MNLPDHRITISLPGWFSDYMYENSGPRQTDEDQMDLAVALSRMNVEERTGGPFGAALFNGLTGELLAAGVNLVPATGLAPLHAEVVALLLAQKQAGGYHLSRRVSGPVILAASTEPCAMCIGAVCWSGITRVLCGAAEQDARLAGFDEGPKAPEWRNLLAQRGIIVTDGVLRARAAAVLLDYARCGGEIYNG